MYHFQKMKITTTSKKLDLVPKSYTHITTTEETVSKVREYDSGITVMTIGVGKYKDVDTRRLRTLCRGMVRSSMSHKFEKIAVEIDGALLSQFKNMGEEWIFSTIAENFIIAGYEFSKYKSKKSTVVREVLLCSKVGKKGVQGLKRGTVLGEYVNTCRDIANTPGGDMTPQLLAKIAQKTVRGTTVKTRILDRKAMEKEKMGAILGVAKGSKEDPRFIILEYKGGKKTEKPIVFVGKGITFDTGGLNLKPSDGILEMHLDMSGGAAVIAAVACVAKLKLKRNIIGLIPAAENMVSGESYRPGDILTSMSGKTIDVLNTDAEGRLVLADALTYAERFDPKLVVDVATLTGAACVALGAHASALMTKDEKVEKKLIELGEESGDYLWPLPLWDEFKQYTKGMFADVANIVFKGSPRVGGAINGGMFLSHFTEKYPWAHIDMAPRMTAAPGDRLGKGATGEPVRLLVKISEEY